MDVKKHPSVVESAGELTYLGSISGSSNKVIVTTVFDYNGPIPSGEHGDTCFRKALAPHFWQVVPMQNAESSWTVLIRESVTTEDYVARTGVQGAKGFLTKQFATILKFLVQELRK